MKIIMVKAVSELQSILFTIIIFTFGMHSSPPCPPSLVKPKNGGVERSRE